MTMGGKCQEITQRRWDEGGKLLLGEEFWIRSVIHLIEQD